ncbi:MAG: Uncharacterised protein [Bacteroidota bacterium]|nr:MAG: Uncharacterised protein [Bacteroidota bacterium]
MATPETRRFEKTREFALKHLPKNTSLLDLGTPNSLSAYLAAAGFGVQNTNGENLDTDFHAYLNNDADCVTAFEIFEHMLAPFNILSQIKCDKLIASVPLKLWFAPAYWNVKDDWDKHYHEFEQKQFDYLLEKSGWKIIDSMRWASPDYAKIGIRPLLRYFTPRYYMVYCERVKIQ